MVSQPGRAKSKRRTPTKQIAVVEQPGEHWDVTYEFRDGHVGKIRVKDMTMRDGIEREKIWWEIAERVGLENNKLEMNVENMHLVESYPLIRFGTEAVEGVEIPQTEADFWSLPEKLVMQWVEAVREVNPQYAIPFVEVRRMLEGLLVTRSTSG